MRSKPALNRPVREVVSIGEFGYRGEGAQAGEAGMHDDKARRLGVKRRRVLIGWLGWWLEGLLLRAVTHVALAGSRI